MHHFFIFTYISAQITHCGTQQSGNLFLTPPHIWRKISGNACLAIKVSRVLVLKTGILEGDPAL
jgi:hypothetical protein